jgi:hypothetical protein
MFFWSIFNWSQELPRMSADNRGILLTANVILTFVLFYFSVMSFLLSGKGLSDISARSLLLLVAGFYLIRAAASFIFFRTDAMELFIAALCLLITGAYIYLFATAKNNR